MKLKQNGGWINTVPLIKKGGVWKKPIRYLVKQSGNWIEFVYRGILNNLLTAQIGVGVLDVGTYIQYGFANYNSTAFGNINQTMIKTGHQIQYIITGSKAFTGVGPYQWIEMAITGDASALYAGDLVINGAIGRLVRNEYNAGQNRTYINWTFDTTLPTSGQWAFNS